MDAQQPAVNSTDRGQGATAKEHGAQPSARPWYTLPWVQASEELLDEDNPRIQHDIIRLIAQYLDNSGYTATKTTLYDEANVKWRERTSYIMDVSRLRAKIMEGEWDEVDRICLKPIFKGKKGLLYSVYKQQYLELIEDGEYQKAFTILNRRLKPLESQQSCAGEFRDLCYLLTAKSVQDAAMFRNWDGIVSAREKLVEYLQRVLEFEVEDRDRLSVHVPPNRMIELFRQAVAYQINTCNYRVGEALPTVPSLLEDYTPVLIPNAPKRRFVGHQDNVKCVTYIGEYATYVASGSSDNTVRIWDTETGECVSVLEGHKSRVWDLCADRAGATLFSASGDRTVRVWDIRDVRNPQCTSVIEGCGGDVYSVALTPYESHLVAGGYDRTIRLYDRATGRVVQTFAGHELSVTKAVCNPLGNLVVSGAKDHTIRFWDILSGTCVNKVQTHLGEVTSVAINEASTQLLSSSKDNSNRLWDLRTLKQHRKLKGHQNTSKNFIRSRFAKSSLVVGGSEDGLVYVWDQNTGALAQRLEGHTGIVYDVCWDGHRGLLCSASDDCTLRTWHTDFKSGGDNGNGTTSRDGEVEVPV